MQSHPSPPTRPAWGKVTQPPWKTVGPHTQEAKQGTRGAHATTQPFHSQAVRPRETAKRVTHENLCDGFLPEPNTGNSPEAHGEQKRPAGATSTQHDAATERRARTRRAPRTPARLRRDVEPEELDARVKAVASRFHQVPWQKRAIAAGVGRTVVTSARGVGLCSWKAGGTKALSDVPATCCLDLGGCWLRTYRHV